MLSVEWSLCDEELFNDELHELHEAFIPNLRICEYLPSLWEGVEMLNDEW
jgi:hypothetical protein